MTDLSNTMTGQFCFMAWRDGLWRWALWTSWKHSRCGSVSVYWRIPWTARRTNDEVLRIINKDRELLDTIKRRKAAYLGPRNTQREVHQLLQLIIERKTEGKRRIGRKKMSPQR